MTPLQREALQMCLEYIETGAHERRHVRWKINEALTQPQQDFSDAYQGAREDLAIWKKRALEAEELNRKFIADINGQTFMGEPAQQEPVATLWQHGETGRTRITMPGDITDCDARWFKAADLYTSPPVRKPLTNEQIETVWRSVQANDFHDCVKPFARAIEAAHGIKGEA